MCENILLLSEDENNIKYIKSKLLLLRNSDRVVAHPLQKIRKIIDSSAFDIILIDESQYNRETILKTINSIKEFNNFSEIIIVNSDETDDFISQCYDNGASNCVKYEAKSYEYMMAVLNSFKINSLKERINLLESFLYNTSSVNPKNSLITHKALKESFSVIQQNPKIKKGILGILTLDETTKTKISMNRLLTFLKKYLRETDILSSALGYFYVIFENIDLDGAKVFIEKIDKKMGDDVNVRAGLSKIGNKDYDSIEKQAKDSLKSAINNDKICVALGNNKSLFENDWLTDDNNSKHYKLFKVAFDKKLKNIIEPSFYRFEKECVVKIPDCIVNQYANQSECNFTLKKENNHSELIIRHDGFAKINMKIVHFGLETKENSEVELNMSNFTERELNRFLKQLKSEFLEGIENA